MTDFLTTLPENVDAADPAEPVTETSALRAHIERVLRKLTAIRSSRRDR
ncbi:hypothetical protein ACRBEV_14345 [Methylobacterium phyllosphaerae]